MQFYLPVSLLHDVSASGPTVLLENKTKKIRKLIKAEELIWFNYTVATLQFFISILIILMKLHMQLILTVSRLNQIHIKYCMHEWQATCYLFPINWKKGLSYPYKDEDGEKVYWSK